MKKIICNFLKSIVILLFIVKAISCSDDEMSIGREFVQSQTDIILIDTFSVQLSTVVLDSFQTNGDSMLMVGAYTDENTGKIRCSAFFRIGIPDENTVSEKDIYDSITLKLTYSGYSFGDTNRTFKFSVHRLTKLAENSAELYNVSSLPYESVPLANCSIVPSPNAGNTIEIRLDDSLGADIFKKLANKADEVSDNSDFFEYFNGLALIPDTTDNNAVINFTAKNSDLELVIYSEVKGETENTKVIELPIVYNEYQFNRIVHDFTGTYLQNFIAQRYDISSTNTDNISFLMGGAGLLVKLKFPFAQELLYRNKGAILKTELILYPDDISINDVNIPQNLILYESDKYNRFGNPILSKDQKTVQSAVFKWDRLYNENTSYTFDLTSFFVAEFAQGYFDPEHALILSLGGTNYTTTFERLNVSANSPKPRLNIYYVQY